MASTPTSRLRLASFAAALLGLAASLVLASPAVLGLKAPGCAPGGHCDRASASVWSTIPGIGLPVACLAAAYFAAALAGLWIWKDGPHPPLARWASRAAALAAILYIGISVLERIACPYCLASHAAALTLWVLLERRTPSSSPRLPRLLPPATTFAAVLLLLGVAVHLQRSRAATQDQRELEQSRSTLASGAPTNTPAFAGRFWRGPADAKVRVVAIMGYQCPECRRIEDQLAQIVRTRTDTAMSILHFPFCSDCNRAITTTTQPNGCWAARLAEAAGIIEGPTAFWAVHDWLVARGGSFTDQEVARGLAQLRLDPGAILAEMQSPRTLELVRADVERALSLGIRQTPMIFINNTELRGWNAPDALSIAIRAAAEAPTSTQQAPAAAPEKMIEDWRLEPRQAIPVDAERAVGSATPRIDVVLFVSLQDDNAAALDSRLRAMADRRTDLRYSLRHFPADPACNPAVSRRVHPLACRMARMIEAAAMVAGPKAAAELTRWTLENHRSYTDAGVRGLLDAIPADTKAAFSLRDSPEVSAAVARDVELGRSLNLAQVPALFINGRRLPRWTTGEVDVLDRVIEEAAAGR
jgi:protein-disulfide isomerase/uncharacterized membrane protein